MGTPGLQLFLPRQVQEEREEGDPQHGSRIRHRKSRKQPGFGLGFIPLDTGCSRRKDAEHPGAVCSSKDFFSPLEGSHVTQEGAGIPDELQGSGKAAPSRAFPARKVFLGSLRGWTEPTPLPKALWRAREGRKINLLK